MILDLLIEQRDFSLKAFGPHPRLKGVHDHLTKELQELKESPEDLSEWADCVLLSLDGAMRAGASPVELNQFLKLENIHKDKDHYRGQWHELRRDLGHLKTCNHLEIWKAWAMVFFKFLIAAIHRNFSIEQVIDAAKQKLQMNKQRDWPDWQTVPENQAIEHVK
ncbi:hypothetical protein N473_26265 [Pseudoalteromonas luteoviolacea CPMOR-1]|uniref:dATP/dGTP diphosphohydrolase MazZ domain-containing protein n=1 Tax=Pseudoalteromonas luteoviolacea CPMOR-1 TaxID=1365248 RepID=A0A167I5H3_9GAMM|nr:dATP/dGTP pyrophosphohydrolase domain-containing protein [Pseudoalteromonas luteoviolacea]KZN58924.1 hypothetical protein N473_26265 [Pseudoalteromonas luteoviolacea CPMOR-1]